MKNNEPHLLTPFDELTMPENLRLIKLLIPYFPASTRKALGVFIKFCELQYTITYFQSQNFEDSENTVFPFSAEILDELAPYLTKEEQQTVDTLRMLLKLMDILPLLQSCTSDQSPSMTDIIKNMLTPEQQEMFQNYQEMFSDNPCQQ